MRNVVFRVLIFYVLAIAVLSAIVPHEQAGLMESPFVQVFDMVGIPYAADLMNFVILTAILSVGNSGLYASTRILWAMSKTGMAPKSLSPLSKRGVPLRALSITLCFALISLMTSFVAADTLFMVLMAVSGMSGTVTGSSLPWLSTASAKPSCVMAASLRSSSTARRCTPGAAAVHHLVQFVIRVPGLGRDPASVAVLGLWLHCRVLRGVLPDQPSSAGAFEPSAPGV